VVNEGHLLGQVDDHPLLERVTSHTAAEARATRVLTQREVSLEHDAIHAVIAATQQIAIAYSAATHQRLTET